MLPEGSGMLNLQLPGNSQGLSSLLGFTQWTCQQTLSGPERRWGGWKPQGRLKKPEDNAFLTSLSDFSPFLVSIERHYLVHPLECWSCGLRYQHASQR